MATKAKLEANDRWDKKQDRFLLRFKKGHKDEVKAMANAQVPEESLNEFIIRAIDERMERLSKDKKDGISSAQR